MTVVNEPPTVATAASATPGTVTGTTSALTVLGADDEGEGNLSYTWSTTTAPGGAPAPTFSVNGSNAAKNTTVTFGAVGTYGLTATITDAGRLSVTSGVTVTVSPALTNIVVSPATGNMALLSTQTFTAVAQDQFGSPLTAQPTARGRPVRVSITTGGGGFFTAPGTPGSVTITATSGSIQSTANVTVYNDHPPTVATAATATLNPTGTTAAFSVLGADDDGESYLSYTWSTTAAPSGAPSPTFSVNGTNAAKNTTVTFGAVGTYHLTATIADAGGLSVTSNATVVVQPIATTIIAVSPATVTVESMGMQQFGVTCTDQFGKPFTPQANVVWSATGGGITSAGLFTAPGPSGSVTVTATSGSIQGTANVTVANAPPTVATVASATPDVIASTTAALTVLGADDEGESNLSYTWSTTTAPNGAGAAHSV